MQTFRYVILGGGMVAGYAAREFVARGVKPGELAIVSADNALPYERPPLTKGFLRGSDSEDSVFIEKPEFYRDHGIEVRLDTVCEGLNGAGHMLRLRGGEEWRFEKLLIATGARVRRFDLPGAQLAGLHYLRSLGDSRHIREHAEHAETAVVIGGGFIGMEAAASLAQRGLHVTMLIAEDRMWQRLFTPEMSEFFRAYYEERNVAVRTGAKITGFTGSERVEAVQLASGERIPADLVVAGIGVTPETGLFQNSGLALSDGITVNAYLETNLEDIYAAGDVANYHDALTGKQKRVEHWDNAVSQGQHAARVMMGEREPFEHVPYFFSDIFDLSYEVWGDPSEGKVSVQRGPLESKSFSVWWVENGRGVAAFLMGRPDDERERAQQWVRERKPLALAALADTTRPLT